MKAVTQLHETHLVTVGASHFANPACVLSASGRALRTDNAAPKRRPAVPREEHALRPPSCGESSTRPSQEYGTEGASRRPRRGGQPPFEALYPSRPCCRQSSRGRSPSCVRRWPRPRRVRSKERGRPRPPPQLLRQRFSYPSRRPPARPPRPARRSSRSRRSQESEREDHRPALGIGRRVGLPEVPYGTVVDEISALIRTEPQVRGTTDLAKTVRRRLSPSSSTLRSG